MLKTCHHSFLPLYSPISICLHLRSTLRESWQLTRLVQASHCVMENHCSATNPATEQSQQRVNGSAGMRPAAPSTGAIMRLAGSDRSSGKTQNPKKNPEQQSGITCLRLCAMPCKSSSYSR